MSDNIKKNPFDDIDPLRNKNEKMNQLNMIKKEIFVDTFIELIKDKDKKTLLKINELLIKRLNELN
tara:strand:+ start:57 stop:254 length:198 start_codon:yes stop_codon:yes gene_type:complete